MSLTVLSRFDAPVDGVSPSAEVVALTALEPEAQDLYPDTVDVTLAVAADDVQEAGPDLVDMLNFVGGSFFVNDEGLTEVALNRQAFDRLRPWQRVQVYRDADGVPQAFWEDVYRAYCALVQAASAPATARSRKPLAPCRNCHAGEATHPFAGRPRMVCENCADIVPEVQALLTAPTLGHCRRDGVTLTQLAVHRQVRDFGRSLGLCQSCYGSRAVHVERDGSVSW